MMLLRSAGPFPALDHAINRLLAADWPPPPLGDGAGGGASGSGLLLSGEASARTAPALAEVHLLGAGVAGGAGRAPDPARLRPHALRGPVSARLVGATTAIPLGDAALLAAWLAARAAPPRPGDAPPPRPLLAAAANPAAELGWEETAALLEWDLVFVRARPERALPAVLGASLVVTDVPAAAALAEGAGVPWAPFAARPPVPLAHWADLGGVALGGEALEVSAVPPPALRPSLPAHGVLRATEAAALEALAPRRGGGGGPAGRLRALWGGAAARLLGDPPEEPSPVRTASALGAAAGRARLGAPERRRAAADALGAALDALRRGRLAERAAAAGLPA